MDQVGANKTPTMREACDMLARHFGWDGIDGHCRMCNQPIHGFDNELSEKEYAISGMCQDCQNDTFGA